MKRVFAGKVTNWSELGGRDLPIIVLVRDEDESLTQLLRQDLFGERFRFARTAVVLHSTGDMNDALQRSPGAIGFTSYGSVVSEDLPLRPLAVDGLRPSVAALERGAYPYMRSMGVVYRASQSAARVVPDYLRSPRAGRLLRRLGYAPS